jgi:ribonuclease HI
MHVLWLCPAVLQHDHDDIKGTNRLASVAQLGKEASACFWLRGLAPADSAVVHTPFPLKAVLTFVGPKPRGEWTAQVYFTDGSGGPHSSVPSIRRCGYGIAVLKPAKNSPAEHEFSWGAFAVLPGRKQTVPRAELEAIVAVLRHHKHGTEVRVVSDSELNVKLYLAGPAAGARTVNSDMWAEFWQLHCNFRLVDIAWCKGHAGESELRTGRISLHHLVGNSCADALAGRAAQLAMVGPNDSLAVLWARGTAVALQKRFVAVLAFYLQDLPPKVPRPAPVGRLGPLAVALASMHKLQHVGTRPWCIRCGTGEPILKSEAKAWHAACVPSLAFLEVVQTFCPGPPRLLRVVAKDLRAFGFAAVHGSHKLLAFRGLLVCERCGKYCSAWPRHLQSRCPAVLSASAAGVLSRVKRGLLPPGLSVWPAGKVQPWLLELGR